MPWQQPPKEVCWFGCLQAYAARGVILVFCGIKIILSIYMSSNLLGKKDFWYHHAVVFSIQEHQILLAERPDRAVADPVPSQY